ncbi:MAG: hypothetical protein ACKVOJ_05825 [Sphingomonadaceae bacterium]
MRGSFIVAFAGITLTLAGCGGSEDKAALNKLDAKLGGKGDVDPALTSALEDQIMVDPSLSAQANEDSIRPAAEPNQAPIPADRNASTTGSVDVASQTLGSLASDQAITADKALYAGCALDVSYSIDWSNRMPSDLPVYPQGRVSEAAGSDNGTCKLRAVTFASAAAPRAMIDFYASVAKRSGYKVAQKDDGSETTVSGSRVSDGAAFYAIVQPNGSGSSVDLVANRGR